MGEKIGTVVLKGYAQKHECPYEHRIAICIENNTKFHSAQLVLMMYYQTQSHLGSTNVFNKLRIMWEV